ncbi:hypothetical protein KAJ27_08315 [bacterium]|nr:hypothetical protein [bacterium]
MENILFIIKLLAAISGCCYVINIYKRTQQKHPVFHYDEHSTQNESDWRWRKPDNELGLKLEDDQYKSSLHIPLRLLGFEKGCIVAGYIFSVITLGMFVAMFFRNVM